MSHFPGNSEVMTGVSETEVGNPVIPQDPPLHLNCQNATWLPEKGSSSCSFQSPPPTRSHTFGHNRSHPPTWLEGTLSFPTWPEDPIRQLERPSSTSLFRSSQSTFVAYKTAHPSPASCPSITPQYATSCQPETLAASLDTENKSSCNFLLALPAA